MGTNKTRREKIEWLTSKIRIADEQGLSLNKNKLLNQFCLETFSTIRTAEEITSILINTDKVFIVEEDLLGPNLFNEFAFKKQIQGVLVDGI